LERQEPVPVSVVRLVLLIVAVAGCASQPAATPRAQWNEGQPQPAVGCVGLAVPDCNGLVIQAIANPAAAGHPIAGVQVTASCLTTEPCPFTLVARPQPLVLVELADGAPPVSFLVRVTDGRIALDLHNDIGLVASQPGSARVAGPGPFPFEVGHCGLARQVDFDGSFWDIVGFVDGDSSPLFGDDTGTIRLLTPDRAEYRNVRGFSVRLARHRGPKFLEGCA
jgi:hypothetical protein